MGLRVQGTRKEYGPPFFRRPAGERLIPVYAEQDRPKRLYVKECYRLSLALAGWVRTHSVFQMHGVPLGVRS